MNDKQKKYLEKEGWIINQKGRKFIKFAGLLWLAHELKLKEVKTEMIAFDHENQFYIYRAVVTGEKGTYEATGDANKTNTTRMIWPSMIRMAETRSVVRALKLYTGTGFTAMEELPGEDTEDSFLAKVKRLPETKPEPAQIAEKFHIRNYKPLVDYLEKNSVHKNPIGLIMAHYASTNTPIEMWTAKTCDYFIQQWGAGNKVPPGLL